MIELNTLMAALAALIHRETGLFAIDARLRTAVYPSVFVEGREKATTIIAGGRQVLRRVDFQLTCLPDREREAEGVREMVYALYGVLLPWFSACSRRFAPVEVTTSGADMNVVGFSLEFCDLPPQRESVNTQLMDSLSLSLGETAGDRFNNSEEK